ncbi:MAG: DNA starvation/stationary phase protection protein [Acidimicrobiia bacterium]
MEHPFSPAGLDAESAENAASILQSRLASLIDLELILKHVHWNVVGAGFIAIHELMDEQTDTVRGLIDEVAERITTLGGIAAGLAGQVIDFREADADYPLGRAPVMAHLGALDKTYQRVAAAHREAIAELDEIDPVSGDLITGQTATLEMNHWFVRAHLEDTDGRLATRDSSSALDAATAAVYAPEPGEEETEELQPA